MVFARKQINLKPTGKRNVSFSSRFAITPSAHPDQPNEICSKMPNTKIKRKKIYRCWVTCISNNFFGFQDFLSLLRESFVLLSTSSIVSPQRLGCHFFFIYARLMISPTVRRQTILEITDWPKITILVLFKFSTSTSTIHNFNYPVFYAGRSAV